MQIFTSGPILLQQLQQQALVALPSLGVLCLSATFDCIDYGLVLQRLELNVYLTGTKPDKVSDGPYSKGDIRSLSYMRTNRTFVTLRCLNLLVIQWSRLFLCLGHAASIIW